MDKKKKRKSVKKNDHSNGEILITLHDGNFIKKIDSNDVEDGGEGEAFSGRMFKTYVKSMLDALDNHDNLPILSLTSKLNLPSNNPDSISTEDLQCILKMLSQEVFRLDNKNCVDLIQSIIKINILNKPILFQQNYSNFLLCLISAIPKFNSDVLNKIISEFIFRKVEINHQILKVILNIIPTSTNLLQNILYKYFPHKQNRKQDLINYVSNLLKLIKYCPQLRFTIWCLIIENCIKLDVELQNELEDDDEAQDEIEEDDEDDDDEDEDDEEDEDLDDADADADADDYDENLNGLRDEDEINEALNGEEEYNMEIKNISDLSSKLDSIMQLLLKSTEDRFSDEELYNGNGVELFNVLSSLFKSYILPTHNTKCVQFLLFQISQQHKDLMDSYLYLLIETSFSQRETFEKRIKSMQYISSYIARAKNLSRDKILFVVSFLISWMERYIVERENEVQEAGSNMEKFKLFYSVFQTLSYIFCFRYKMLKKINADDDDENNGTVAEGWELNIDKFFRRVIVTRFNPLKFSNQTVVQIFAKISARENLCYCYSIMEQNKREKQNGITASNFSTSFQVADSLKVANGASNGFQTKNDFTNLTGYFPFDPITLKKCRKIVNKTYIQWSEDEDSDSEEDDDDEEDEVVEEDIEEDAEDFEGEDDFNNIRKEDVDSDVE
ncbi:hypothetical protein PACTADRAFT_36813 [Pachysolen tannophilus NRRL Y-2460]|uniref:RNA polymerase I-specific transcription initiation factor RRN3 n=1 Tax=Pachysolen tannophilus NRRL Y-2460 TaxID=669874 RepID=A0A1E4U372_PACTA|nr:hypothetical protein PACTADRAFT_36813 [Pachysolen tannophilus NRRL Y-2460]